MSLALRKIRDMDREIAAFFVVTFFVGMSVSILAPLLPVIKEEFSLSYTLAGLVLSVFGIARLLLSLPSGYLYNHVSRKKLLIIGVFLMTMSSGMAAFSRTFWEFIATQIVMGAGFSFCITTIMISLSLSSNRSNRGRVMGMNTSALSLATVVAPAMSGMIAIFLGWRSVFLLYSIMTAGMFAFIILFIKKDHGTAENDEEGISGASRFNTIPMLLMILVVSFLATFVQHGFKNSLIPMFSKDSLGMDVALISIVLSVMAAAHMIGALASASFSDRYGRKLFLIAGLSSTVLVIFLLLFVSEFVLLVIASTLLGFGTIIFVIPATMLGDITPRKKAGRNYGLQRSIQDLGFIVGPVLLGAIADLYGFTAAIISAGALSLAVLILSIAFVKEPTPNKKINWKRIFQMGD